MSDAALTAGDIAANPLSSIPLSSIPLSSIPLSSIPLSSIEIGGVPLSSIPLSSIPLSSIDLLVDCYQRVGQLRNGHPRCCHSESAIQPDVTYGDLINALSLEFLFGAGTLGDSNDYGELALGQLLMALLLRSDFPWETVPLDQIGAQGFSADHLVTYDLYFEVGGNGPDVATEASVTLPEDFLYVHRVNSGCTLGERTRRLTSRWLHGTRSLTWTFNLTPGDRYSLTFDRVPSLAWGPMPASASYVTCRGVDRERQRELTVVEESRGARRLPESDILYLGHITDRRRCGLLGGEAPPAGYRVAVFLSNLSEDADLVMYRPVSAIPESPVTPRSAPLSSIPFEDDGVDYVGNGPKNPRRLRTSICSIIVRVVTSDLDQP